MALTAKQKSLIEATFSIDAQNAKAGWNLAESNNGEDKWYEDAYGNRAWGDTYKRAEDSEGPKTEFLTSDTTQGADYYWRNTLVEQGKALGMPLNSSTGQPFWMGPKGSSLVADQGYLAYLGYSSGEDLFSNLMPSGWTMSTFNDELTGSPIDYMVPNNPGEWDGQMPAYDPADTGLDKWMPYLIAAAGTAGLASVGAFGGGAVGSGAATSTTLSGGTGTAVGSGAVGSGAVASPYVGVGSIGVEALPAAGASVGSAGGASLLGGEAGAVGATTLGDQAVITELTGLQQAAPIVERGIETSFWESLLPTKATLMEEAGKTLVSQGISTLLGKKNTPKVGKAPALSPVLGMPLPNSQAVDMARRRSLATQMSRQGRASTMLSGREKLGS